MKEHTEMVASFGVYCMFNQITSRTAGYEATQWKFLQERYESKLQSHAEFEKLTNLLNKLKQTSSVELVEEWMSSSVAFLNKAMCTSTVISLMHRMFATMISNFSGYMDIQDIGILIREGLKFLVPVAPNSKQRALPWIFDRVSGDLYDKIDWILFPLTEKSKVFQRFEKLQRTSAKAPKGTATKPTTVAKDKRKNVKKTIVKAKGKAKAKAQAKANDRANRGLSQNATQKEQISLTLMKTSTTDVESLAADAQPLAQRPLFIGDDIINNLNGAIDAYERLSEPNPNEIVFVWICDFLKQTWQ